MLLPQHRYLKPESLEDCLAELGKAGETGQIVAGGTDVIFNMRLKLFRPETVISVRRLPELQQVEQLPDGSIRIGASCRLTDLAEHSLIEERFPALIDSIASVASQHIRNMGTLGGNICLQTRCWYTNNSEQWRQGKATCFKTEGDICHVIKSAAGCHAINNADTPIALIAYDASLTIQKSGSQTSRSRQPKTGSCFSRMHRAKESIFRSVRSPPAATAEVTEQLAVKRLSE
jgi:4-hydroxybenzoyl-CoA reductase subunit beta